jgi:hypothetical protein
LASRRPLCFGGREPWITLAVLGGVPLVWLSGGIYCLMLRLRDPQAGPLLASSGAVLAVCALVQLRLIYAAWRAGRLATADIPFAHLAFWRLLLLGAWFAYLAALAIPPVRYVGCAWLAAVCAWQTLLLLPLAASPRALEDWRKWTEGRAARRMTWLVYASILILLAGEAGLRVKRAAGEGQWFIPAASGIASRTAVGETLDVRLPQPERFRVAILGDQVADGRAPDDYLGRVEQSVPGLEMVSLGGDWTAQDVRSGEVASGVAACRADLVLAVLPVCEDLARPPRQCGYFDWRQFELATLFAGSSGLDESPAPATVPGDFESFLRGLAPQLAACRTPINDAMRDRWEDVFASLDRVLAGCRDARVPLVLVIVPAEFQVNRELCATLLRRYGVPAERFDVELPQRRLAGFAAHRNVPLIDLLPHLRLCRQSAYERHASTLNDEGKSAAATAIGGWLQSRYAGQLAAQLSSN